MPQQALDTRRARRAMTTGRRERLVRPAAAELAASNRAIIEQRTAAGDDDGLALRRRQLEMARLAG
jgi:hypothetical protein